MTTTLIAALVFFAAWFAIEIMRASGVWSALAEWLKDRGKQ